MLSEPDVLVGTMLGKDYLVLQSIGAGGMAVVYLVEHQTLLKRFAAKVLSPALAASLEARARFAQEAHAASQLDHENIVSIFDFGVTVDHRPYFVMELLRGQTLDQRLASGPMALEEVVAVCVPVARALAHAHAEGIVHLDVKPENIFLVQRSQGRWGVKVVDFGIARVPQNPRLTNPGETVGSPMFMAPEVCQGFDDVDQRADVYSFGILLYLMLCGRLPFVDDNMVRVLQMQLVELPPPPREVNTELSPELAAIVERALAKHPDDRYPSMPALLRDLEAALPLGADRLLIESQSGAALGDTPFPHAMSIARRESQPFVRTAQPVAPSGVRSIARSASAAISSSSSMSAAPARRPSAPRRGRAALVIPSAAVVLGVVGWMAWQRTTNARTVADTEARTAAASGAGADREPRVDDLRATVDPPRSAGTPGAAEHTANSVPAGEDGAAVADEHNQVVADDKALDAETQVAAPPVEAAAVVASTPGRPAVRRDPAQRAKRIAAATPVVNPRLTRAGRGSGFNGVPLAATQSTGAHPGPSAAAQSAPIPEPDPAPPGRPAADSAPPVVTVAASAPDPSVVAPVVPAPSVPAIAAALPIKTPAARTPAAVRGSLDAVPELAMLDVKGSLSPSIVKRSVERTLSSLRDCYRSAARAGGETPVIDLQMTFEIDENGRAAEVATRGASFGSLASCAAGVAGKIRTQVAPDVGTAQVTVSIRFRPS